MDAMEGLLAAIAAKDEALAALRGGNIDAALTAAERAVEADETYGEGWAARGTVKFIKGDAAGAEPDLARATVLKPLLAEAHLNHAMALASLGRLDAAEQALVRARTVDPALPVDVCFSRILAARRRAFDETGSREACVRLAMLLSAAGLLDDAEAVLARYLSRALDDSALWSLTGDVARRRGRFDEAVTAARKAAELSPDDPDAAINVAGVLFEAGNIDAAVASAQAAAEKFPRSCRAWIQLADFLGDDFGEGWDAVHAAACAPDATAAAISRAMAAACERLEWTIAETLLERLLPVLDSDSANPLRLMAQTANPAIIRRNAENFVTANYPNRRALAKAATRKPKLTIGYLSPDFRNHPVGTTVLDLLRHHDRSKVTVNAYAVGPHSDGPERKAIVSAADRFSVLSDLSDIQAAQCIRDDGVDILIDLAGHTQHSRLGILAFRPVPLQLHYLGYPGTIGAPFVDYIVGDPWTVPPYAERYFSESIIRLPRTYLVNSRRSDVATDWTRARFGFSDRDVVFCCFNHPHKITRSLFDAWIKILHAAPETILWLRVDNPAAARNLTEAARERGLAPERLRIAPRADISVHMARYCAVDLMLDTTPYNAHTTAADALWMGCPVLTLPGETFASRVCAGLLDAIGLNELIASDLDAYTAKAITLARDGVARSNLSSRLAGVREGILFDNAAFARSFEAGLMTAWERAVRGLPPASFDVSV